MRPAGSGSLLTRVIEAWCDIEGMSWLDLLDMQDFSPDEIALIRCIATGEGCDSISAPEATPDVVA